MDSIHIYHIVADVIKQDNKERYGVLLFNPSNDENIRKYNELSFAIKCTGCSEKYIDQNFNRILKECFNESKSID